MKKYLILIFLSLIFLFIVDAQTPPPKGPTKGGIVQCKEDICKWEEFVSSLQNLIRTIVIIALYLAIFLASSGAFLMMFAGPSPQWYQRGKNMIIIAITGYFLLLLSGVIFDLILDFFQPKFKTFFFPNIAFAQVTATSFYDPLKNAVGSTLNCGKGAVPIFDSQLLGQIFACIFEILGLLKNVAIVLLVLAILASAAYLITTPLFGLRNISTAWYILIWSIVGLLIVLLADVIRNQICLIVKGSPCR